MINKRLIGTVPDSKKYIAGNVICQWVSLAANITMMASITYLLARLFEQTADTKEYRYNSHHCSSSGSCSLSLHDACKQNELSVFQGRQENLAGEDI